MLFNSFPFLYFFVLVTILYFSVPQKWRTPLLLAASCYFYMSFVPIYLLILCLMIVVDYFAGILIEKASGSPRKVFLITSLIANLGVLGIFKYYNFFNRILTGVSERFGIVSQHPYLAIILPIGLSFHTFQSMSYTIEVYRGKQAAERNFLTYALYVMFYPQLVAGPIERPQNLLHQFKICHQFEYQRVADGLKLMAWGLFKKVAIADRLAIVVDQIFDNSKQFHGLGFVIASIFFSFQIFCDFSGYSDMALGAAKVMGFTLMKNFNQPYRSKSVGEFWTRWHISLSTWFKDYLYIPLGGNKVAAPRWYFNLLVVFLISGLWHGAEWTFVAWGGLNGLYLIADIITSKLRGKLSNSLGLVKFPASVSLVQIGTTYTLIVIAWIFFRSRTIHTAVGILRSAIRDTPKDIMHFIKNQPIGLDEMWGDIGIGALMIVFLESIHRLMTKGSIIHFLKKKPKYYRWTVYSLFIFLFLLFGTAGSKQFIYFQF